MSIFIFGLPNQNISIGFDVMNILAKNIKLGLPKIFSQQRAPKRKNIGKHWKMLEYIKQVQDIRDKEMNETPTRVSRS